MATFRERIGQHQFSTLISIAKEDLFDKDQYKVIKRIKSTRNPFSFHPIVIVADPFLFVQRNELYLFYEEQVDLTGNGVIKMTKTKDLVQWTKPLTVLEETFHLSYPNVFECEGQIYMMPETGSEGTVKLYKPNANLTSWKYYKTLLKGHYFVDSSIVFQDGYFFLFTTDYTNETNVLRLFFSDKLDDNWTEHPQSPIASGKDIGRCGGSIFNYNNKLYRPCQLTQKMYGEGLDLYQITALSKMVYKEERLKTLIPNVNKMYREGGHHFNFCNFKNQMVVATDIFEIKLNYLEIAKRLVSKIKS